jgi:hypothetical protein
LIEKGKYRVGVLVDKIIGKAWYQVDNLYFLLSVLSINERKFITREGHTGYNFVMQTIYSALKEGGNFIDVGANMGYMSLSAANFLKEKGTVYSFEPSPREYKRLLTNIEYNRITNIKAINKGISKIQEYSELNLAAVSRSGMNSRHEITSKIDDKVISEFIPIELAYG